MRRPGFAALWLASLAAMLRDKGAALLLLGAPVLYGFFYPWFYAPQVVQRVPVALVVQDASGLSRQMLRFAQASPRIDPRLVTADEGLARAALMRGEVQGYALIAPDFKRDVVRGAAVVVPVYANGAYPLAAKQVQYGFAEAFGTVSAGVEIKRLQAGGQSAQQAAASRSPVNLQAVALFNPTEGYGSFVVAAVALLILQQTLLMGGALLVGTWREQGLAHAGARDWLARLLALCVPGWLAGWAVLLRLDLRAAGLPARRQPAGRAGAAGRVHAGRGRLRLPAGLVAGRARAGAAGGPVHVHPAGLFGRLHLAGRGLARAAAVAALAVAQYGRHPGIAAAEPGGRAHRGGAAAPGLAGAAGAGQLGGGAGPGARAPRHDLKLNGIWRLPDKRWKL